jgi:kinesin family protein C2/C3
VGQSPDVFANLTARRTGRISISPNDLRQQRAYSKRHAAAEWIKATIGIPIPCESEESFRKELADGVILCHLVNALKPGTIPRILTHDSPTIIESTTGDVIQTFENLSNFVAAAQKITGETLISVRDLEKSNNSPANNNLGDDGRSNRDQVVECILSLRDWQASNSNKEHTNYSSNSAIQTTPNMRPVSREGNVLPPMSNGTVAAAAAPATGGRAAPSSGRMTPPTGYTPLAEEFVNCHGAGISTDTVNFLMQSATFALKSRMGAPATPPAPPPLTNCSPSHSVREGGGGGGGNSTDITIDAVGPVLESVLANLTNEYEKRLLAKDQEHKAALEAQQVLKKQVVVLEQEARKLKTEVGKGSNNSNNESTVASPIATAAAAGTAAAASVVDDKKLSLLKTALKETEKALHTARQEAAEAKSRAVHAARSAQSENQALKAQLDTLKDMEARFAHVRAENRELYNTVQDLKGAIRVFARVRPHGVTGDIASATVVNTKEEDGFLQVFSSRHGKWQDFKFDRVFSQGSTQHDVYAESAPLIRSVLDGYNVCIFAYGQTGSGKTHTMSGDATCPGINPQALQDLFMLAQEHRGEVEYSIKVQLLEIYNEQIRDLLVSSNSTSNSSSSLQIIATAPSGANVPEASQITVCCAEDVQQVMAAGARNRSVAETNMNEHSSRSHQVLTVIVEGRVHATNAMTRGCLHLIDLAGSERVGRSGAEGKQLLEAQHINKSLSALGSVMHALAVKAPHIPFRDSKLTQLLQDSLGGQAKAMMFVHVAPEQSSDSETLSTLNFGKSVTEITLGHAKKNVSMDVGALSDAKSRVAKLESRLELGRKELQEERNRNAALEAEIDSLRAKLQKAEQVGRMADGSSLVLLSHQQGAIRAHRPAGYVATTPVPSSVPPREEGGESRRGGENGEMGSGHVTPPVGSMRGGGVQTASYGKRNAGLVPRLPLASMSKLGLSDSASKPTHSSRKINTSPMLQPYSARQAYNNSKTSMLMMVTPKSARGSRIPPLPGATPPPSSSANVLDNERGGGGGGGMTSRLARSSPMSARRPMTSRDGGGGGVSSRVMGMNNTGLNGGSMNEQQQGSISTKRTVTTAAPASARRWM